MPTRWASGSMTGRPLRHGASAPLADMVGEFFLLLIKLAGKMKRAAECVDRIRNPDKRETFD